MAKSVSNRPNNVNVNPVSKIQSLIKNLDKELLRLGDQCTFRYSREALRITMKRQPGGENTAKLTSIPQNMIKEGIDSSGDSDVFKKSNTSRSFYPRRKSVPPNTPRGVFLTPSASKPNQLHKLRPSPRVIVINDPSNKKLHMPAKNESPHMWTPSPRYVTTTSNDPNGLGARNFYRAKVHEAYRNRKIFTVYGNYGSVRRALLRRGWLEKLTSSRYARLQSLNEDALLHNARRGNDYEAVFISKLIKNYPPFFIWQPKRLPDFFKNINVTPYRNRVRRKNELDFSTKVGLIGCADHQQWVQQEGFCAMSYPRFFRLAADAAERQAFIDDFRLTQCRCLLRFISEHRKHLDEIADKEEGTVPINVINFALSKIKAQIAQWENRGVVEDEKENVENPVNAFDEEIEQNEWQFFFINSNLILQLKRKFRALAYDIESLGKIGVLYLDKLEQNHLDYKWDGCRNLWILKPGYQSRGNGIVIRNTLNEIIDWTNANSNRRYIVQKYVERPLLIYKTKFDIRQYMLLSIGNSMVSIWLYKDCYLRFSSQEFSIDDVRQSIHLTNNSVQKKYKNKRNRDKRLPPHNMWSLEEFKTYLKIQEKEHASPIDIWNTKIYAGFKQNLIAVVLASLEETELTENAFELYGCDFMLDENYKPILIEINSTPDLSPSTQVTANICPKVINDLVKVIVDLPHNKSASVGLFEMIYDICYKCQGELTSNDDKLVVCGKGMQFSKVDKTANSTFRNNFFRRPGKILSKLEKPIKKLHKNSLISSSGENNKEKEKEKQKLKSSFKEDFYHAPLKSIHKEALAVQYTRQK